MVMSRGYTPWPTLMEAARNQADIRRRRVRVVGVRSARGEWAYVVQCRAGCSFCGKGGK